MKNFRRDHIWQETCVWYDLLVYSVIFIEQYMCLMKYQNLIHSYTIASKELPTRPYTVKLHEYQSVQLPMRPYLVVRLLSTLVGIFPNDTIFGQSLVHSLSHTQCYLYRTRKMVTCIIQYQHFVHPLPLHSMSFRREHIWVKITYVGRIFLV